MVHDVWWRFSCVSRDVSDQWRFYQSTLNVVEYIYGKKGLNLQKIARKCFSVVLVSLRCPEKHIKSLQKSAPPKYEKNLLEILKKKVYIIEKKNFLSFFIVPSYRKSCEDHESPHFYGSTIISFRVTAILKSIFLDLCFFLKKNRISFFEFLGKLFF